MTLQKGNKILIQLEVKAAKVNGGTIGGAAVVNCITAGKAVEVNYSAAGRQQGVSLAAGKAAKVKNWLQAGVIGGLFIQVAVQYQRQVVIAS